MEYFEQILEQENMDYFFWFLGIIFLILGVGNILMNGNQLQIVTGLILFIVGALFAYFSRMID